MTMVFMENYKCKKCGTIYDRPKLMSISIFSEKDAERVDNIRKESKKGCPECGSDDLELIPNEEYCKKGFWDFLRKKKRKSDKQG